MEPENIGQSEINICVFGSQGVGKSSFLNDMIKYNYFKTGLSTKSITNIKMRNDYIFKYDNKQNSNNIKTTMIRFIDTPGLGDLNDMNNLLWFFNKIKNYNNVRAIIFCFDNPRIEEHLESIIIYILKLFTKICDKNQIIFVKTKFNSRELQEWNTYSLEFLTEMKIRFKLENNPFIFPYDSYPENDSVKKQTEISREQIFKLITSYENVELNYKIPLTPSLDKKREKHLNIYITKIKSLIETLKIEELYSYEIIKSLYIIQEFLIELNKNLNKYEHNFDELSKPIFNGVRTYGTNFINWWKLIPFVDNQRILVLSILHDCSYKKHIIRHNCEYEEKITENNTIEIIFEEDFLNFSLKDQKNWLLEYKISFDGKVVNENKIIEINFQINKCVDDIRKYEKEFKERNEEIQINRDKLEIHKKKL